MLHFYNAAPPSSEQMSLNSVGIITIQVVVSELLGISNIKEWSLAARAGGGGRGKTGGNSGGAAIMVNQN